MDECEFLHFHVSPNPNRGIPRLRERNIPCSYLKAVVPDDIQVEVLSSDVFHGHHAPTSSDPTVEIPGTLQPNDEFDGCAGHRDSWCRLWRIGVLW